MLSKTRFAVVFAFYIN